MVEPFDYKHKNGNSGVTLYNNAENPMLASTAFNGGMFGNQIFATPRYVGAVGLRLAWVEWIVTDPQPTNVRFGIYLSSGPKNLYPTTLDVDAGALSMSVGAGTRLRWTVNRTYTQGVIWLAWLASSSSGQVVGVTPTLVHPTAHAFLGKTAPSQSNLASGLIVAQAYGAMPATFPAGAAAQVNGTPAFPYTLSQTF